MHFFKTDVDLEAAKRVGSTDRISSFIKDELERAGKGKKDLMTLIMEFDSDENVDRKFHGDYFARLH